MSIKNFILSVLTAVAIVSWIFTACAVAMETTLIYVIVLAASSAYLALFGIANGGLYDV